MKTILKVCAGAWLLLSALSCSHDKLSVYEDVDRVYFSWALSNDPVDQYRVNLGYDVPQKEDSTIRLSVNLLGKVSDKRRPIAAEVIREESSAISGEDIEIITDSSYILPNREYGYVFVKVKNTDRAKINTLAARIRLVPNEYFYTDMSTVQNEGAKAALEITVEFDAKGDCPNLWLDATAIQGYFKEWSKVKEDLIYEQTGLTRENLMYDAAAARAAGLEPNDVANERIPGAIAMGVCIKINRYLEAYKTGTTDRNGNPKQAGEPLYDEFGIEVTVAMTGTV